MVEGTKVLAEHRAAIPPRLSTPYTMAGYGFDIDVIDTLLKPSVMTHPYIFLPHSFALPLSLHTAGSFASGTARRFRMWVVQPGWEREGEGEN